MLYNQISKKQKKCPYCGEEILVVAKKCKYCGEWLEEKKQDSAAPQKTVCPVCAEEIDPETAVCPYCHEHIGDSKETAVSVASATETPKKILETGAEPKHSSKGFFAACFFDTLRRHYADFRGTESRKSYWCFILCEMAAILGTSFLGMLFGTGIFICFYLIISLALCIPTLAITVRRLHDIGKTGWWILIAMIPLAGPVWLLILLCKRGKTDILNVQWTKTDTILCAVLSIAIVFAAVSSSFVANNDSAKYFLMEEPIILPNGTKVALATDNKEDVEGGYLPCGDMTIVVVDGRNIKPILSSSQLRKTSDFKDVVYESLGEYADENSDWAINHIETLNDVPNYVYFEFWANGLDVPYDYVGLVNVDTGEIVAIMYE